MKFTLVLAYVFSYCLLEEVNGFEIIPKNAPFNSEEAQEQLRSIIWLSDPYDTSDDPYEAVFKDLQQNSLKFIWEFERRPFTKISLETYLRHIQKLGWEFEKRLSGAEDDEIKFNSTFLKQMIDQLYTVPDEFDEIQKLIEELIQNPIHIEQELESTFLLLEGFNKWSLKYQPLADYCAQLSELSSTVRTKLLALATSLKNQLMVTSEIRMDINELNKDYLSLCQEFKIHSEILRYYFRIIQKNKSSVGNSWKIDNQKATVMILHIGHRVEALGSKIKPLQYLYKLRINE